MSAEPDRTPFYKRRSLQVIAVVIAVPILALAWWLGSPLFIDQVVNEPFPRAAMGVVPEGMTDEEAEEIMVKAAATDQPATEPMPSPPQPEVTTTTSTIATTSPSSEVAGTGETIETDPTEVAEEVEPVATTEPVAPPDTSSDQPAPPPEPEETTTSVSVPPPPTGPVALASGELVDGDSFHKGSGQVVLYELEDGSRLIRLEDIEVTNGPDLHVLLTPVHNLEGRNHLKEAGYIDLGQLKGNIGSQNYEVPADYVIPDQLTLVIYCVPFQVVFTTAELA